MKKLIVLIFVLACMLGIASCASKTDRTADIPELSEFADYTQEQLEEKLLGLSEENMHSSWGEPDGTLSRFWGDIYHLPDSYKCIILYYDADGIVETVKTDYRNDNEDGKVENIKINDILPSFSYGEELQVYEENDPGVKCDGFYNTSESEVTSLQQVIDRAKNECTIKYDMIDVFYDNVADIWQVVFSTAGTLGGCQTVYLDNKGLTCLIIYGE